MAEVLDPELDAALKRVLEIVVREHALSANQLLVLAAELQRLGVHRLVEEHLQRASYRRFGATEASAATSRPSSSPEG